MKARDGAVKGDGISKVWHGLSKKMVFENFATYYFDCPTSTTTNMSVAAARFTSQGQGIILELQSKYKDHCAVLLDVSPFSRFPEEREMLALNEPLIISDILKRNETNHQWQSLAKWVRALLYFEKIATGNAADETWNISDDGGVMETLADIMEDHLGTGFVEHDTPQYVLDLFRTYLGKQEMPRFDDIDSIRDELSPRLKQWVFHMDSTRNPKQGDLKVSPSKIRKLFPNALNFTNEKGYIVHLRTDEGIQGIPGNSQENKPMV